MNAGVVTLSLPAFEDTKISPACTVCGWKLSDVPCGNYQTVHPLLYQATEYLLISLIITVIVSSHLVHLNLVLSHQESLKKLERFR